MENKLSRAARHNQGKIDFTLLPIDALEAEARVWMLGEAKYGRDNWQKLWGDDTCTVVMQSLLRHAFAIVRGELLDRESGEHHAAHIRCNAAMLIRHYAQTPKPYEFSTDIQHEWIQQYDYNISQPYKYNRVIQAGAGQDHSGEG